MTYSEFSEQMARIKRYFTNGEITYSKDRVSLIWPVVKDLPKANFIKIVEVLIGENTPDWSPRVSDFREKAAEQQRILFREECHKAQMTFRGEPSRHQSHDGLKKTLEEMGVNSLLEAIQKKPQEGTNG